ncbi:MAG: fructose-1,6-bisphosphatase [Olsenella sp.]|nr:fructose-1,6-bisphosphatase [Olsenella sp.]
MAPISSKEDFDLRYSRLLAREFPNRKAAVSEIINLETILSLPRGTEHFVSDIHGEHEAFVHILNNCSGVIREQIRVLFSGELDERGQAELRTLVYYPHEKLERVREAGEATEGWYLVNLYRLVRLARWIAGKYTRSRVRKAMPPEYAYIMDELMHATRDEERIRHEYHQSILKSIVATGASDDFVEALAQLIKRLAVDGLHVVGDIFDRGPHADRVLHDLAHHPSVDVQWGNHDIAWMGAACGSLACICSVVRTSVRYDTLDAIESAYGIPLRHLALFAEATYKADDVISPFEKAIDVILFKVEGQTFMRHPDWHMSNKRLLLDKMDLERGVVSIDGREWELSTTDFPTLDPSDPYRLSPEEADVLDGLADAFRDSGRLRRHVGFLYEKGSLYLVHDGNLLLHGCIPMQADGTFSRVLCEGVPMAGKTYLDFCDHIARRAWAQGDQSALDWMYYLWCGAHSPLSGRVVKTFERAFVRDRAAWEEPRDPYYELSNDEDTCIRILAEFGLSGPQCRIINGHTPVRVAKGETPVRANGRKLIIDGGFCEAYHKTTGIAGYTLVSGSHDIRIKAHRPFRGIEAALDDNADIMSESDVICRYDHQVLVSETDRGKQIAEKIADLTLLIKAYEEGRIAERAL